MITLFIILLVAFVCESIGFAVKLSWKLLKACLMIFVVPVLLIGCLFTALSDLAVPILIVIAIVMLVREGRRVRTA